MAHYGHLGSYEVGETAEDIRGTSLYGRDDDKLGKIKDVIFDHSTGDISYVVVDTGGWLKTKDFIVPAARLRASEKHEHDFASDLTKEQVESFPPYNEKDVESQDKWADYEGRYRSKWDMSPVMHREGTDRNITPTTQQLEGNRSSEAAAGEALRAGLRPSLVTDNRELDEASVRAASVETERIVPAGQDSVLISSNAAGIGPRYDTFQARLRERRREAAIGCSTCSIGSESGRDDLKEAV
jgi:sporulation protein YlmC with PRC-barrel domain